MMLPGRADRKIRVRPLFEIVCHWSMAALLTVGPRLTGADQSVRLSATTVPNRHNPAKLIRHHATCVSRSLCIFNVPLHLRNPGGIAPANGSDFSVGGRGRQFTVCQIEVSGYLTTETRVAFVSLPPIAVENTLYLGVNLRTNKSRRRRYATVHRNAPRVSLWCL